VSIYYFPLGVCVCVCVCVYLGHPVRFVSARRIRIEGGGLEYFPGQRSSPIGGKRGEESDWTHSSWETHCWWYFKYFSFIR